MEHAIFVYVHMCREKKENHFNLYRQICMAGCLHEISDHDKKILKLPKGLYVYTGELTSIEAICSRVKSYAETICECDIVVFSCDKWIGYLFEKP